MSLVRCTSHGAMLRLKSWRMRMCKISLFLILIPLQSKSFLLGVQVIGEAVPPAHAPPPILANDPRDADDVVGGDGGVYTLLGHVH